MKKVVKFTKSKKYPTRFENKVSENNEPSRKLHSEIRNFLFSTKKCFFVSFYITMFFNMKIYERTSMSRPKNVRKILVPPKKMWTKVWQNFLRLGPFAHTHTLWLTSLLRCASRCAVDFVLFKIFYFELGVSKIFFFWNT